MRGGVPEYDAAAVAGRLLSDDEKKQRKELINQIRNKGYDQVMEEVAYTWFNRFIALRFMEVNNYLPTHIRVFSDASGAFKPEILSNAIHLDLPGLDMGKVSDLIEKNQNEDLYRYLLLTQCNALSDCLPRMFEKMGSYTELLLPNNILRQDGILGRMVSDISEEDWTDQVQIIGWLYQYYNTELKDETFALLKKNVKITKERIPSATQLFTPDWIVRYMVENSLGRLWIEGHPDDELKAGWKYYLDEAEQEPEVQEQLEAIRAEYRTLRPQDIKIIDPCMGSGHILVYAFDVLVQIYKRAGFSERDAAQSILGNNLYGLDVDERAAQLAYFAVMMKARQYDRRIFTRNIQPHVYAIAESNDVHISARWRLGSEQCIAEKLVYELKNAKEYGSILNLSMTHEELESLRKRLLKIKEMASNGDLMDMIESLEIFDELWLLVEVADVMVQKYDVVVTNPPYIGSPNIGTNLLEYIKANYDDSKADLYSTFIERNFIFSKKYVSMITQSTWMFQSRFEKIRTKLYEKPLVCMNHLGTRAFDEISGEVVQTTAFCYMNKRYIPKYRTLFVKLIEYQGEATKENAFFDLANRSVRDVNRFKAIPGAPFAHYISDGAIRDFEQGEALKDTLLPKQGTSTGDDDTFVRYWTEPNYNEIGFGYSSTESALFSGLRYFPLDKGGEYRKWYGNNDRVIRFDTASYNRLLEMGNHLPSRQYYFHEGLTWSKIASELSVRFSPQGFVFSSVGLKGFPEKAKINYILTFMNSCVCRYFVKVISPGMSIVSGDIEKLPFIFKPQEKINNICDENINVSKADWDSFEASWDFQRHPLVRDVSTVQVAFASWQRECEKRFQTIKANEEELNRIFIDIYGLQEELSPEVKDKDVTVRCADLRRDIRSMISYAVGCMFGRYSLEQWGLAYAGGEWNPGGRGFADYGVFEPDKDNIIPICDDEYFDDDITGCFVKWVEVVFGKETLEENLKYIADALGGKGMPRQVIRNYFLNDFYADHLKTYQKRPIYWLFDSGKKNGFKALIYMHRYQSDLLARMRTDYVHEQQERYRTQLKHIGDAMDSASASGRVKLAKQQKKLQEQALELQKYEEKIHHLADQNIEIDLDDGVKHNYALFEEVLAKIK